MLENANTNKKNPITKLKYKNTTNSFNRLGVKLAKYPSNLPMQIEMAGETFDFDQKKYYKGAGCEARTRS